MSQMKPHFLFVFICKYQVPVYNHKDVLLNETKYESVADLFFHYKANVSNYKISEL